LRIPWTSCSKFRNKKFKQNQPAIWQDHMRLDHCMLNYRCTSPYYLLI
jgi:hypothetical protein